MKLIIALILSILLISCSKDEKRVDDAHVFEMGACYQNINGMLDRKPEIVFIFAQDNQDRYYGYKIWSETLMSQVLFGTLHKDDYFKVDCPNGEAEPKYISGLDGLKMTCQNAKSQGLPYDKGGCEFIEGLTVVKE